MYYQQALIFTDIEHSTGAMDSKQMSTATATSGNLGSVLKPQGEAAAKVKPCCVCKDEKASRDECMLFTNAKDPQKECATTIQKYKMCMQGFGFEMP